MCTVRRPDTADTIAAIATPAGPGALGVVRLTGARAGPLAARLFRPSRAMTPFPPARTAVLGTAMAPGRGGQPEFLDQGVLLFFPASASPTGEDLVEFTLHGSPLVLATFLEAATRAGARPALPGEFTYRAFLNGRLDAVQAEAIDDLIRARTRQQARAAHRQQTGALSRAVEKPRSLLVEWLARIEGSIEFSATEEDDFLDRAALVDGLREVRRQLDVLVDGATCGLALRGGVRVVLAGRVNTGKSSLFNQLVGFPRTIVAAAPGTTRDTVEAQLDWDGLLVTLVDTAGDRSGTDLDPVESEGQRRSRMECREADLILWLVDPRSDVGPPSGPPPPGGAVRLLVVSKSDLGPPADPEGIARAAAPATPVVVSGKTGAGTDQLRRRVLEILAPGWDPECVPLVTRLRQKQCLEKAVAAVEEALGLARDGAGEELIALPLHAARTELGELTGRGGLGEIYEKIFATFCIGK